MDGLRTLLDEPKVVAVITGYAAAIDTPDWEALRSCFKSRDAHGLWSWPAPLYGRPLARRELLWAFIAAAERFDEIGFQPGKNDFAHHPSLLLRGLKALHIGFTKAAG